MSDPRQADIRPAIYPDDVAVVRTLFAEYIAGLGVDLTFQDVETELADLPGRYAPPAGEILLARQGGRPVGCVALRPMPESGACEMKRLYVRTEARGQDLGRRLAEAIVACARRARYDRIRLDTLPTMGAAQRLYGALGFQPTAPYYESAIAGTIYMARDLRPVSGDA